MIPRPLILAALVAVPLLVAVTVLSLAVVRSDQAETSAAQVRLALWRLDAQAGALLVAEASAAPEAYRAFHVTEGLGGRRALVPSPLLALPQEPVLLHVQIGTDGTLTSPQVPDPAQRAAALAGHTTAGDLALAQQRLTALDALAHRRPERLVALVAALPALPSRSAALFTMPDSTDAATIRRDVEQLNPAPVGGMVATPFSAPVQEPPVTMKEALEQKQVDAQPDPLTSLTAQRQGEAVQALDNDFQQRAASTQFNQNLGNRNSLRAQRPEVPAPLIARQETAQDEQAGSRQRGLKATKSEDSTRDKAAGGPVGAADGAIDHPPVASRPAVAMAAAPTAVPVTRPAITAKAAPAARPGSAAAAAEPVINRPAEAGPMQAQWLDGQLLLMRRARIGTQVVAQAAVVDWPRCRHQLLTAITDLLPAADLATAAGDEAPELRLAALPVRLVPGSGIIQPLRPAAWWTLLAAWLGTLIGITGTATLLTMAHRLGERRAAFVSAVTHELRTPLTSMRLHADLLADPRIANDPDKRAGRIAVLRAEAGRLAHLIDNVLDYARLERRRPPSPRAVVLAELLTPLVPRLGERLAAAGLALTCAELPAATVRCDAAAVERILFNLADNAAKYATNATDRTVMLRVLIADRRLELRLRDHGPGVAADVRARLFVPFARSAEAAAGHAPGVGLGLALCRRLARAQGGDLRLDEPADGQGTEAVLTLPLAG